MPQIDKHLVLSNHHIHPEDVEMLESEGAREASNCLLMYDTDYGWVLYVGGKYSKQLNQFPWMIDPEAFASEGWKTNFEAIGQLAWKHDCEYVTFDKDGEHSAEIACYDW